ncbi:GntR family transcriptional regulator [Mangrovicoccus algicola]|uniref:GntR family transcriptional regulator n=1 Tax=Mangrovicoccus algicola TaxID=2771008 RepID=A0A8J6YTE4_9RHOB|nr:GntR family transcriptional regulator [Mangrovicoccus algicola]MBE3638883.1 GntR family transcriptional regulator [Mangrovicoccus algicola]
MDRNFQPPPEPFRHEPGSGRVTAASRIYDDLRQRILSLELPPGAALLRADLAKAYDVSQTPLRDALQRLEQDGLIRVHPQSRTLVTRIDLPKIDEAMFLRLALETEVVTGLARGNAADGLAATLAQARRLIELQRSVARDRARLRDFQQLDEVFHHTLFAGLGREALHALLRSKSGDMDRVRRLQRHSESKLDGMIDDHLRIVEAVEAGDAARAARSIRAHLHKPADWVEEYRLAHPGYFT